MSDGLPPYIGFAGLWRLELSGLEIARLGPILEARLSADPANAEAMMDIATLSILTLIPENRAPAFAMQAKALELRQVFRIPAARQPPGLRVLAIASPGDMTALTHLDCLLEDSDVDLEMLYARADRPMPGQLPDHDLVFIVAGESGPNRPVLERIAQFTRDSRKPVLNRPEKILQLSRDSVSEMLKAVAGVCMPATVGVDRASLEQVSRAVLPVSALLEGAAFPIIARPEDSQGGKDLAKLDNADGLADYLSWTNGDRFFISRFIDYSGKDGQFRKYRVVMIGGRPFACHMAISSHWMIHYVNADMDQSEAKRSEEARFMAGFDEEFAVRHRNALAGIDRALGLDYYAIDCAETREGELLVFEADTAMLVHAMDPADLYPYKAPAMRRIFEAFRQMLEQRRGTAE